jgi:hypothetical protein
MYVIFRLLDCASNNDQLIRIKKMHKEGSSIRGGASE